MTIEKMIELFKKYVGESSDDTKICRPRDLSALIFLNNLVPGSDRMLTSAEHDVIYLDTDIEKLAEKIAEEGVKYLVDNGVYYDSEYCSLIIFP